MKRDAQAESGEEDEGALNVADLEERRRETNARLRLVVNALRDAGAVTDGYDSAYFLEPLPQDHTGDPIHSRFFRRRCVQIDHTLWLRLCDERFAFDPPDRFRVEWDVNSLGREKCRDLWDLFDRDQDGTWSYTEFVEYMTALEARVGPRPEMRVLCEHEEVWRMYMTDLFELDLSHCLTFDGFLQYRESIEEVYPLANELPFLGITLEWRAVEKARMVVQTLNQYLDRDGAVAIKYAQFLMAECGLPVSYQELWQALQRQRLLHRCHRFLLGQKRTLRLFGYKQKTFLQITNPALEEDPRVCQAGLRALLFSSWTPADRTPWRKFFLLARLGWYSTLRRWKQGVSSFFDWTRRAAQTGLLRASCLQSTPERELGDYVIKLEVGPAFTTHSTINVTYYSDADSAATLHELKYLERGAECFVYIDLLCRNGTRESDAQWLCQRLTWFVELFFKEHLEVLPHFFKWFITVPSKIQLRFTGGGAGAGGSSSASSGAPVIRLVVLFTGEMDLYAVMQSLNLPSSMQFDHFLQRLSIRWMFSHSIEEIMTNKRFVGGTQWSCRGQLDARFNRQAWGQVFRQCAMKMDDQVVMEREEQDFMAHQQQEQQQQQQAATQPSGNTNRPGNATATDRQRQKDHENGDGSLSWRKWLHRLALVVDSSNEMSMAWSFRDLTHLLEDNVWIKTVVASDKFQWLQRLLSTAGGFAIEWKSLGDSLRTEFATSRYVESVVSTHNATTTTGSTPAATTAAAGGGGGRTSAAVSRVSSRSALPSIDDLGPGFSKVIGASLTDSFPFASPVSTPSMPGMVGNIHSALFAGLPVSENAEACYSKEDPLEYDLLELYEACVKTLQSVQTMRAEAGTSGLGVAFEGWNVFSILPRVIPTTAARRISLVRTRSTASNGSASSGGTASTHTAASSSSSAASRESRTSRASRKNSFVGGNHH